LGLGLEVFDSVIGEHFQTVQVIAFGVWKQSKSGQQKSHLTDAQTKAVVISRYHLPAFFLVLFFGGMLVL
jgi:hypothetical protein